MMRYCTNPSCPNPFNPEHHNFCSGCGSSKFDRVFRSRYQVLGVLTSNQFGRSYEAIDRDRLHEPCIIKQLTPDQASAKEAELFQREVRLLQTLGKQPQIPQLLAYFQEGQHCYFVEEWIEGTSLLKELQRDGAFHEAKIWQVLSELLPVLQLIHTQGIIHRNIKPESIIRSTRNGRLVLANFNLAKDLAGGNYQSGTKVGGEGYAPRELASGQILPCGDLYSLGVTCLRLLTGCLPREDGRDDLRDGARDRWLWRENLPRGIQVSTHLGQVLERLTQECYTQRYSCAREVLAAMASRPTVPQTALETPQNASPNLPQPPQNVTVPPPNKPAEGDYSRLQQFLAAQHWQAANLETIVLILRVVGREAESELTEQDIQNFPCTELRAIDGLWTKYSNGRFGFSVQKQIWRNLALEGNENFETWERFGHRVGWRVRKWGLLGKPIWQSCEEMSFKSNAPKGNLPRVGFWLSVLKRFEECEL
ncbi:serine/threonine-protein kinase [Oscillatoria sp. FACHB-1406]|uniref:serine/threonine-protein kinase n=1 Tax=Oscillatoria sp. FACHB-1406 TaxID=2692846 RepID=UPI001685901C|nr:serine/threonine-protein kinase [Oscillatoria sp. FACHB-1406]MBD2576631.1 GUN4 domain-containing protein [Oscillatoria sp. FACHB-1406]